MQFPQAIQTISEASGQSLVSLVISAIIRFLESLLTSRNEAFIDLSGLIGVLMGIN